MQTYCVVLGACTSQAVDAETTVVTEGESLSIP